MAKVVCAARHPIDLADGRSIGPGDTMDDVDVENDEHNKQLVADGIIVVMTPVQPPAGPVPDSTSSDTGGDA